MENSVNCQIDCVNGCILGEQCPHREHAEEATKFIQETSLDKILAMAEEARRKKLTQPPQWVIPDDF
ncbi:hypothetical protein VB715_12540 [Crocosphaera sp. UHCC 0190]|uniref:hypothetical protein n=1 Tax=Crocosphaera sp. UHCC 0190 TaxID=3110246 RepID=UPI002B1EEF49|nr:hypothetical protein [Crocosphaera sp. UHCC 0190]MEA5510593.1 hypothetical protein [Crocosphaera sp. UHCC 0190]